MDDTQVQIEDALVDIIAAIYSSQAITEEQKDAYVKQIENEGVSEALLDELQKIFEQEGKEIEGKLQEKNQLADDLQVITAEELQKNDKTQAQIVAAVDDFAQKNIADVKEDLEASDEAFMETFEEMGSKSEEDAIRAKLQQK